MTQRDPHPRAHGEPCSHRGCQAHRTHPCEGCGRIMAQGSYPGTELTEWYNQYMVDWIPENPLYELARAYLTETEDYDQRVCRARKGKIAIPVTREERRLCTQNASHVFAKYVGIARERRLEGSLRAAIQRVEREWEETYIPLDKRGHGVQTERI